MAIKSPCINVCTIDKQSNLCFGCARTMAEIREWPRMTEAERDAIMAQIDERMLVHFGMSQKKPA